MNDVFALIPRKERISLRLWVFKFIDVVDVESFGVCVEGYRPSDETETVLRNWHSTAIEKRVTSTLLHSHSGSVYELRGSIDRDLAFQFGYPPELIDMFANGFPEDWKSTLKEYFYIVKTTNPLNASYYFSVMARRRSSGFIRCQTRLSTGTVFNKSNRRSERLSILPAPGALPVPIIEEDEQKENSTSRSSLSAAKITTEDVDSVPPVRRSPRIREILSRLSKNESTNTNSAADVSAHSTSSAKSEKKPLADVGSESNPCLRTSDVGDLPNDLSHDSDEDDSIVFVPAVHSNKRDGLENLPRVEYPDSIASEENDQDLSVGPAFEEPHISIEEINAQDEQSKVGEDTARLAVVPVSTDVFKIPSRRPSKGENDDAVELTDWSIRFAPIGCDGPELNFPKFVLLGNRRGHYGQWRSSIVTRVASAEVLYTSSTKYRLVGEINITDSASAGFPKTFVASFLRGFPPNWRTRITDLYNTFFGNMQTSTSHEITTTNKPILLFSDESREAVRSSHEEHEATPSRRKSVVADYNEKWERDSLQNKRTEEDSGSSKLAVVSQPVQSSSSSGVRRSRSGRCIHPPLAQWAGERIRYDGLGNAIGVEDVKTITVHSKGTSGTTALADYYGLSPADASLRQSEASTEPPRLAVDSGPKKIKTRRILASSDEENAYHPNRRSTTPDDAYIRCENRRRPHPYEEDRACENYRRRRHQSSSDESETERELRSERHLILKHTRELLRQQENLLKMEQRLASHERKWLERKKRKRLLREKEGNGFCRQQDTFDRRPDHRIREESRQVSRHMPPSHHENDHRKKKVMNALDRRRLEEIWAQENEELDTSYYSDGDDDWQEPVRKRRKKVHRRVRETSSSESVPSDDENSGDQIEREFEGEVQKKDVARKKGWNAAEVQRLKLTIHAIRPQKDDDWEKVARAMGNERDLESYKEAAIKRLKWKSPPVESTSPAKAVEPITARAGTIAFQHQTNEFTRKYMMGGGAHSEDFFQDNNATANISISGLPDLNEFGADDSLLEVLHTPANIVPERKGANRRQFLAEPIDDDTPIRRRSSAVFMGTPQDSAQRERQDRYLHHLISKAGRRDVSKMNFSRAGNSTRFESSGAVMDSSKAHDYGGLQKDLKYAAKLTKKAARRDAVLEEESDEDLELDEEELSADGIEDDGLL